MALSSMTGFARSHGASGPYAFEWELKSVNAKGFDLRMRLPPGWDDLEALAKKRAGEVLSRGTVYANLNVKRANTASTVRINEDVLASIVKMAGELAGKIDAVAPSIDGLLGIKGVIEVVEPENDEAEDKAAKAAAAAAFEQALANLVEMRQREGVTLGQILSQRMDEIERLAKKAEAAPGRKPEAIKARLAEQIAALLEASDRFDADRLNQEAIMIAAKADIREELDRIASHISQVREMIGKGGPIGRRLDFLAQEFNREVNTCCSKSNDLELTNTGLEMKNVVEQFREQVQNLEEGMAAGSHGFRGVQGGGLMFVLSSPSGAGKTTLSRMLVAETPALQMSVSATTRPKRPGETEGRDYYFVDQARFDAMVAGGELLEWTNVFDNRYGTPRAPVEAALAAGKDVLFDIDWQGTQQLRSRSPNDGVSGFIPPPAGTALEQRLHTRAQDSDEVIRGRMRKAGDEISHFDAYDYIIVNDNIGIAFEAVKSILRAEQLKRERQVGLSGFVRELQRQLEK